MSRKLNIETKLSSVRKLGGKGTSKSDMARSEAWRKFFGIESNPKSKDISNRKIRCRNRHGKIVGCQICGMRNVKLTKHHLIPVSVEHIFGEGKIAKICEGCHRDLHKKFNNHELGSGINEINKLRKVMK